MLLRPLRGPTVVLTRSTVSSSRHRVFASVTGLMLVFAAVFLVVSVLESLKSETRIFARVALNDRVFLRVTPDGAAGIDRLRKTVPELKNLLPVNQEIYSPFLVRAIDRRMLNVGTLSGDGSVRDDFAGQPRLILSTRCADDFGYEAGDWVTLATRAEGAVDFQVLAVTDEYGFAPDDRIYAAVSAENMQRYWCQSDEADGGWYVAWSPKLDADRMGPVLAAATDILGADNLLELVLGEEIGGEYLADLDRDFGIFYAILVLTVMLGAIGVLNSMVIAVMERRREIGLLRAVGLTGGQVARMLMIESGVFGVLGGVLGLILGIPLAIIAARTLTSMSHLDLVFELSPRATGAVVAGSILVALLAVLYPALRANRLSLSTVMRYE
jgi:putative ABC transport system permease protein